MRAVTLPKAAKVCVFPPTNKKHSAMGTKDQEKDCSEAILRASHMEHILDPLDDGLTLKSPH